MPDNYYNTNSPLYTMTTGQPQPQPMQTNGRPNLAGIMTNMGQQMSDQGGAGSGVGGLFTQVGEKLGGLKNKDGAQDMSDVPMAQGSFYQPIQPEARSSLLQTMMQRSRMGRNQGA